MKILVAAFALAIASPAFAQGAPDNSHAQHQPQGQHQPGQHGSPQGMTHGQHQPGQHDHHQGMQHGQDEGHAGHGCCADRDGNGRMDCCEAVNEAGQECGCCEQAAPAEGQPQGHQHH